MLTESLAIPLAMALHDLSIRKGYKAAMEMQRFSYRELLNVFGPGLFNGLRSEINRLRID